MVSRIATAMSGARVSVLIPVFNRPGLVERAIDSALAQSHGNIEVVVIDNASTDNTWDVVRCRAARDSRVRCVQNETNIGPLRSWCRGLEQCTGDYLKILWSDDWIAPTFVEESLAALARHPRAGIVFTATRVHDPKGDESLYHFPEQSLFTAEEFVMESIRSRSTPVSPGCTLARRECARFRTEYPACPVLEKIALETGAGADMLFIWEAAMKSGAIAHVPRFLSHFDRSPTSITMTQTDRVARGYAVAAQWYVEQIVRDPALRRRLMRTRRQLVHVDPWLKRWERAVRHSARRAAATLAARLGWRAA